MCDDRPSSDPEEPVSATATPSNPPHVVSSRELLKGRTELWIEHEGQMYRLQATSRGKLYLTK